jgi:hypothetical protein
LIACENKNTAGDCRGYREDLRACNPGTLLPGKVRQTPFADSGLDCRGYKESLRTCSPGTLWRADAEKKREGRQ